MGIVNWLNKPFPLIQNTKSKLILVLSFGIFVFLFLIVFQPFGSSVPIIKGRGEFLLGFGFTVSSALAINYLLLPKLLKTIFNPNQWKIKKEILYLVWSIFLIAIFNYSYNTFVGKDIAVYRNFIEFLGITFAIGLLPVIIMVFLIEKYLSNKNSIEAKQLTASLGEKFDSKPRGSSILIHPETVTTEPFELVLENFMFATSDNNYTTIYYQKGKFYSKKLLRLSLKNLEKQLSYENTIIRCHRSYLVNKNKIQKILGNARSMELRIIGYEDCIPVSRNFQKEKLR